MTISDKLKLINTEKEAQYIALTNKGIDMDNVPFTDYHNKIEELSSDGTEKPSGEQWVRPSDRPTVPEIAEDEQVIYWLFGVQKDGPNDFAITLSTSAGQYRIEWGDGTQDNYNGAVKAEHMFDYDSIAGPTNVQGYKWVWIKAYPLIGNITSVNMNVRHSFRPNSGIYYGTQNMIIPQVFEWYMRGEYITGLGFGSSTWTVYSLVDIFHYYGTNSMSSAAYMFYRWKNLKRFIIDTSRLRSFSNFMRETGCYNLPLNIDTSNGTAFDYFMNGCPAYNQSIVINLISATSEIGGNFIGPSNYSLKSLRLQNMSLIHATLNIANSSLDVPALVDLFGDLPDRTGTTAGALTITGVYGAARLTEEQRDIARNKNWVIT